MNDNDSLRTAIKRIWGSYGKYIDSAATTYHVPRESILATILKESFGDPNARGSSGEIGLGQIMPATARGLGYDPSELWDPSTNIMATAQYLSQMRKMFNNDPYISHIAYNAGPKRAQQYREGKLRDHPSLRYADTVLMYTKYAQDVLDNMNKQNVAQNRNNQSQQNQKGSYSFFQKVWQFLLDVIGAGDDDKKNK